MHNFNINNEIYYLNIKNVKFKKLPRQNVGIIEVPQDLNTIYKQFCEANFNMNSTKNGYNEIFKSLICLHFC
jgi:hypothetical protein